jgi:hypothetical protein
MQRLYNWRCSIGVPLTLLLFSFILLTLVTGQVFSKSHLRILVSGNHPSTLVTANKSIFAFPIIKYPNAHNVRIISPVNGKKVTIGKNLLISGISAGNSNATYINCHVSIIVNGIKPYRTATASGPSGSGDYSKWTFTLTPNLMYNVIKAGQNKITAMYSCANSPSSLSHYSVNVTGININIGNITRLK